MATSPYIPVRQSYNANVAAVHGATTRWTYTVPAGRRSVVEYVFLQLNETTAIAGLGTTGIFITINGVLMMVEYNTGVVGLKQGDMSGELSLIAGDILLAQTFSGVATAVIFTVTASIKEYQ